MSQKLKYEKYNNSDNVIMINLHNGYTIIAISTFDTERDCFVVSLLLKENTIDTWKLIEGAEKLEFYVAPNKINSTLLKYVAGSLEKGFFDYYIQRYEYEMKCSDLGFELIEKERLGKS